MYERATVAINTSVLSPQEVTRPQTSCEKQVASNPRPARCRSGEVISSQFNCSHPVPEAPGETRVMDGCTLWHRAGGGG